jgi:hypothetical protein
MRTKLLAAAAILAAGFATVQAQNVYSLNVVGYVNLTLKPGYNLITPQLKDASGSTAINTILTNAPTLEDFSTFFGWNAGAQTFTEAAVWVGPNSGGPAWFDAGFNGPVADTAPRGQSYFLFNAGATDTTLTLVGEVPQGTDNLSVPANYAFLGDSVPTSQEIKTNGFPIADFASIFTFNPVTQSYTEALVGVSAQSGGPAWYDAGFNGEVIFAPAVGQGFVHFNPGATAPWSRTFTVPQP